MAPGAARKEEDEEEEDADVARACGGRKAESLTSDVHAKRGTTCTLNAVQTGIHAHVFRRALYTTPV
eukprot:1553699-Pyramimonas_sp.AAC.1